MSINNVDIFILSDNCLDTVGGEQESTKIIIDGLKDKFSLGIIQPGKIGKPKVGVTYFTFTKHTRIKHLIKAPFSFLVYLFKVKDVINQNHPKIIHTQAQVSFFIIALFRKYHLISKDVYFIHTERGLYTKYNKLFKCLFFFFMKELDMLITTTEFNLKCWREALARKGLSLEYNLIENTAGELFETFDNARYLKKQDEFTIGFAGRYTDWKNWPLAVKISEELNSIIGTQLKVKMAVGCLDEKALKETKIMFDQLQKTFGSRFDGKINISIEEMDKFYYDIDAFILTSNYNTESFGRTLVEAMSRYTAALTTPAGGATEVLGCKDNICTTVEEFIEIILYWINNPEKLQKEKEKNLNRVKRHYSLDNNINKHYMLYKKEIQRKKDDK